MGEAAVSLRGLLASLFFIISFILSSTILTIDSFRQICPQKDLPFYCLKAKSASDSMEQSFLLSASAQLDLS
ncbi:hypothetical protein FGO68_gene7021 [Halteria grandinella]|uniref:Uncharacterized protein n=1 Tax=Halteria grandinella TaxID=5974 RepID=A0A8J8P3N5_HALGN|nr:hypothetical protein FGO68_gene7021 [Halteria grandinella]